MADDAEINMDQTILDLTLSEILKTASGRMLIWTFLSRTGVFRSSFSTDGPIMAFQEGRRSIGLEMLTDILRLDQNAFTTMLVENQKRESQRQSTAMESAAEQMETDVA